MRMTTRLTQRILVFAAGFIFATQSIYPPAHAAQDARYTVMAAFLYNFLLFTEWPAHPDLDSGPYIIGVLGANPFERAAPTIEQRIVGGRQIAFRHYASLDELQPSHVLFVSPGSPASLAAIRERVANVPTLLVGESEEFTRRGGMIRFFEETVDRARSETTLRVEINRRGTDAAGIRFRSQLLRLAQVVDHPLPTE